MDQTSNRTTELYDKIRMMLMAQGLTYWEAFDILSYLDAHIYNTISGNIVDKLDENKSSKLDILLNENSSTEKIAELLEISVQELQNRYEQKLEEYVNKIPELLSKLKNQNKLSSQSDIA